MWNFSSAYLGRSCLGWVSGDEPGDLAAGNLSGLGAVNLAGGTGWLVILALGDQKQHGNDEWECAPACHPGCAVGCLCWWWLCLPVSLCPPDPAYDPVCTEGPPASGPHGFFL